MSDIKTSLQIFMTDSHLKSGDRLLIKDAVSRLSELEARELCNYAGPCDYRYQGFPGGSQIKPFTDTNPKHTGCAEGCTKGDCGK